MNKATNLMDGERILHADFISLFDDRYIHLNDQKKAVALTIYKIISEGNPATLPEIAAKTNIEVEEVGKILKEWQGVFYNKKKEIQGFWGISLVPMKHIMKEGPNRVYNWCAWDALFIPPLLGESLVIRSECPVTHVGLEIEVGPEGTKSLSGEVFVSFVLPSENVKLDENVIQNFCHKVHFFSSKNAAENWVGENPGTVVITLEEAYELGAIKNREQFGNV